MGINKKDKGVRKKKKIQLWHMTVKARLLWDDLGNEVRIAQVPVHTDTHALP